MEIPDTSKMLQVSRKRSGQTDTNLLPKKRRKHSESADAHEKSVDNELESLQSQKCVPHQSIGLMYRLTLSILYLLRIDKFKDKNISVELTTEDDQIDRFRDIVIRYKDDQSLHIEVEDVDTYNENNFISFVELFGKSRSSSLNNRFNSFAKSIISTTVDLAKVEYLIIHSNSRLNLTDDGRLRGRRSKYFYPFKLRKVNLENRPVLKELLCSDGEEKKGYYRNYSMLFGFEDILEKLRKLIHVNFGEEPISLQFFGDISESKEDRGILSLGFLGRVFESYNKDAGGNFYKFSRDEASKEELLRRLQFNVPIQKLIARKDISPEFEMEMKEKFVETLVIASGMPRREKLRIMIDEEIEKQDSPRSYTSLQREVLSASRFPKTLKDTQNSIPGIMYELDLLTSFLHTMFCNEALYSLGIEGRNQNSSSDIIVNYKNKVTVMRPVLSEEINYRHLFPPDKEQRSEYSVNECFALFLQKLKTDVKLRFFIIFTNASLDLGEDSLKFKKIDAGSKNYKMLRKCEFFKENKLYQFSSEEVTRKEVLSLLKCPDSLEEELCTEENKEMFLKKFILAVDQADQSEFKDVIEHVIEKDAEVYKPPYDYEGLNEIAIRALESRRFGFISRKTMEEILEDVKMKRSSHQELKETDIEIIKFAKIITKSKEGTSPHFNRFLKYLTEGSGKRYLEFIKENEISLATVSSILDGSTSKAAGAFKDLCDLWFDTEGNKTFYLENLEKNEINLRCFSSITSGAGSHGAETFKALHDILFDSKGNKTRYSKTLEREGMNLADMSALLNGTGGHSIETFKRLYILWFGEDDKKTKYLEYLKREEINLKNITSILHGAGVHSPETFKTLCDLWFDRDGHETHYLKTLKKQKIHLSQISSILNGAGAHAATVFKDLYNVWFTERGKKQQVLKTLDRERIKLSNICAILRSTGANVVRAFTDLYNLLFDAEGNRTEYLVILEEEGIHFQVFATILARAATGARRAFTDLFNLWFDENGNKKVYLEVLEESRIPLSHVAGILSLAGANAAEAFKLLYNSWFDSEGQKTASLLHFLEKKNGNCFTTAQLRKILYASRVNGAKNFETLHDTFFNEDGSPTEVLKDFYDAKLTPWDLTNMLRKKTHTIASTIKQSHDNLHVGKEEERSRGDFCSGKKGPKLLEHFVKEGFSHKNLEKILQECDAPKAFKKLHHVCFDKKGKKTQILEDFYGSGFKPRYLTKILRKTGDDASQILSNFHASCFGEDRHLERFLSESELFTPKNLCKVLGKRGGKVRSAFEKLRKLCYKRGRKTKYLKKLMKDKSSYEIIVILCGEVGD